MDNTTLHPSMVTSETPFTPNEIIALVNIEHLVYKGNKDFEDYFKVNGFDMDWYVENEAYNVYEVI